MILIPTRAPVNRFLPAGRHRAGLEPSAAGGGPHRGWGHRVALGVAP